MTHRLFRSLTLCLCATLAWPQQAPPPAAAPALPDPIAIMVGRLELGRYKATVKGLTQFGDRRQGTDRNRAAIDWIEAQLKSYGCTNTERIHFDYQPPAAGACCAITTRLPFDSRCVTTPASRNVTASLR